MSGKVQAVVGIGALVIALGIRNTGADGVPVNIVGYWRQPTSATGEVAAVTVSNRGAISQLGGTGIPIVIRELMPVLDGPNPVAGSGAWSLVVEGKLNDVVVGGVPLALASPTISNGVIRTKDFGDLRIYLFNGSSPAALVVPADRLDALKKWLKTGKRDTPAEAARGE